jgi:hypothetical protein
VPREPLREGRLHHHAAAQCCVLRAACRTLLIRCNDYLCGPH